MVGRGLMVSTSWNLEDVIRQDAARWDLKPSVGTWLGLLRNWRRIVNDLQGYKIVGERQLPVPFDQLKILLFLVGNSMKFIFIHGFHLSSLPC